LHMLEDVLGWAVVLIGAIVIRFTGIVLIDPIMSICVAVFIFINALKNLKRAIDLFLEKTPHGIDLNEIKEHIMKIEGVLDVHHIHIWSMDGLNNYATMHIVTNEEQHKIKKAVRDELNEHSIGHITLEIEEEGEHCSEKCCQVKFDTISAHPHHHHHHH